MWLRVPDGVESTVWEGALEPMANAGVERGLNDRGLEEIADVTRDLPVVSIGQPEVWPLSALYPRNKMPVPIKAKLHEADFYLVRFSCSFRPRRKETRIEWARFEVNLLPDATGHAPVAFDLHPIQVSLEVKRNVKVTLSPSVKFQEVEASAGGVDFGFEYTQLEPLISGTGAGESVPSWDYESAKGNDLQGSKWMHLLAKAPREMTTAHARLDLSADVVVKGFRLSVFTRPEKRVAEPLTVRLWGD